MTRDDQASLFSPAEMRPVFGGRVLTPGAPLPASAELPDLFDAARDAERERLAARSAAEEMRENGAAELRTESLA